MSSVKSKAPARLLACRVCLATDTKLFSIYEHRLEDAFVDISGCTLSALDGFPQHLCSLCRVQVLKCAELRQRCRRAEDVLKQALVQEDFITTNYLATIDRVAQQLCICLNISHNSEIIEINHDDDVPKQETEDLPEQTTDDEHKEKTDDEFYQPDDDEPISIIKNNLELERRKKEDELLESVKVKKEPKATKVKKAAKVKKKKKVKEEKVEKPRKQKKGFKKFFASEADYKKFEDTYHIEIVKLSEEEQLRELNARKETSNYLRSAYKCERCFKGFLSETTYDNHMKKTHEPSNGRHECALCGARFRHPAGLRKHFESHTLKFICQICQFVTRHRSMATMHADFHSGKTFVCKYCGLTFNKQTTFNTHTRVQHPLENASAGTCDVCGETFTGKRGLQQHKAIAHKRIEKMTFCCSSASNKTIIAEKKRRKKLFLRRFFSAMMVLFEALLTTPELKCRVCSVQFENLDAKTKHKENNVCDPTLRPCPTCGERFPDDETLKKHAKELHVKEHYECDQCNTAFAKKSSLAVHFERVHLKIKPKKPAFYKYQLYGKARVNNRNAEICEICGKGYPDTTWLRYHQRTHTGERPYRCADCPKSYMTPAGLQRHIVIHTGVRRWQCSQCPKTFLHQSSIYTHKLVHSGERPFVCQICSKRFTQSGSLQTHVKYVHMKVKPPPRRRKPVYHQYFPPPYP